MKDRMESNFSVMNIFARFVNLTGNFGEMWGGTGGVMVILRIGLVGQIYHIEIKLENLLRFSYFKFFKHYI